MDGDHTLSSVARSPTNCWTGSASCSRNGNAGRDGSEAKHGASRNSRTSHRYGRGSRRHVNCFLRSVPAAVSAIAFLSGGQPAEQARPFECDEREFKSRLPWALAFSFARAIQQPALEIWKGRRPMCCGTAALYHRARCNQAARRGDYSAVMETNDRKQA